MGLWVLGMVKVLEVLNDIFNKYKGKPPQEYWDGKEMERSRIDIKLKAELRLGVIERLERFQDVQYEKTQ